MRNARSICLPLGLLLGISPMTWIGSAAAFSQEPVQQSGPIDPSQIPQVHNTFYTVPEGVVGWDTLGKLEVTSEAVAPLQSVFHTDYSDEVKALDAQQVKLMGFIFPLEGGLEHAHFLLTAWPPSCAFCLPAGPSQMVEVYCKDPVEFSDGAILMAGKFELLHEDPSGMYYRLHDAELVERFDDIRWTGELPQQPKATQ
jgi:uncharacterized protein